MLCRAGISGERMSTEKTLQSEEDTDTWFIDTTY